MPTHCDFRSTHVTPIVATGSRWFHQLIMTDITEPWSKKQWGNIFFLTASPLISNHDMRISKHGQLIQARTTCWPHPNHRHEKSKLECRYRRPRMVSLPVSCASTSNPCTFETKQSNNPLDDTKAEPADDDTSNIACIVCSYVKNHTWHMNNSCLRQAWISISLGQHMAWTMLRVLSSRDGDRLIILTSKVMEVMIAMLRYTTQAEPICCS